MPFTYLYIEDNFIPNIAEDQYRRKKIGIGVTLKEGESLTDATLQAEQFISEYITKNTIYPEHSHQEEYYVSPTALPIIQRDFTTSFDGEKLPDLREPTLEEQIVSCDDIKVLESYKFIAKKDPKLQLEYDKRMYILKELSPKK